MPENPLQALQDLDPTLMSLVEDGRKLAFSDGALPVKFKILIALALDASHGAVDGVRSLAEAANRLGASNEEIAETLRVTQFISGIGSLYTSSRALRELQERRDGLG
ncbi:MAG: carboxymuconolactone decarboxylase family protein [Dehalococcoidales bacterium]